MSIYLFFQSSFKETFMCEFFKTFQEEKFTESVKKVLFNYIFFFNG